MDFKDMLTLGPAMAKSDMQTKLYNKLGNKIDGVLDKLDDPEAKFTACDMVVLSIVSDAKLT